MTLPSNLKRAVTDILALGTVIDIDRHTATDKLLWTAAEKYLPIDLWKDLVRLRDDRYPRRRRDEDASY